MAAGLADHVWEIDELIALMPKPDSRPWGSVKRAKAMADAPLATTTPDSSADAGETLTYRLAGDR